MFGQLPPAPVLEQYGDRLQNATCESLDGGGGLSGAKLWRFTGPHGTWLLRQWPLDHPEPVRLAWIHAVLRQVGQAGFTLFAPPERARSGNTWVRHEGQFWELARWLPGEASYEREPSLAKLVAACMALGQFHLAAAKAAKQLRRGKAASLANRLKMIRSLRRTELEQIEAAIGKGGDAAVQAWARQYFPLLVRHLPSVEKLLVPAAERELPLQPCLGDVWHANVLFDGDAVTGLIDYSAMRSDCVASDIARLLGSMAENDASLWEQGVAAYQSQRPLTMNEGNMIAIYDRSSVLLSGLNWLRWLLIEHRDFSDRAKVQARLEHLLRRIEAF
ncbi:MAG: phosphotransferase [Planctomycetes bacterium]|nr:phosphotransferase [Planctomycetota bacterium]